MQFLDDVESEFSQQIESSRSKDFSVHSQHTILSGQVEPPQAYLQAKENLLQLQVERDEAKKTILHYQEVIHQLKKETAKHVKNMKQQHDDEMEQQRSQFEAEIEKKLDFCQQLIKQKQDIQSRREELQTELEEKIAQVEKEKKLLSEKVNIELKKNKESWKAAEKVRQEAWQKEKTQEIRDLTIKGIEPQILGLIQKHKTELARRNQEYEDKLRQEKMELTREFEQRYTEIRGKALEDRETLLDKERQLNMDKMHE